MARRINAGDDMKRGDLLLVNPFEIDVREELRGRHKPATEQEIIEMALSLYEFKQREPVECRVIENNRLRLNMGFRRTNAGRLLREGFDYEGERYHVPDFLLKATVVDCNEQEAFTHNIVENAHRKQTSHVDDAYNQRTLREDYGKTNAEIARLYRCEQSRVAELQRSLQLDESTLDMVHSGHLSLTAALDLLAVSEDQRAPVLAEAAKTKAGKVKGPSVRSAVREHILNDNGKPQGDSSETADGSEAEEHATPAAKPRSMSEIRKYFEAMSESETPSLARFAKDWLKWAAGKTSDKAMGSAFQRLMKAEKDE